MIYGPWIVDWHPFEMYLMMVILLGQSTTESLAMICVVVWMLGTLLRKITYLLRAPCIKHQHRSRLKKKLEKRIVNASDGSALRNTRMLHLPQGRRHATRRWYVPQHKRGTRVRSARVCHSCVRARRPTRSSVALTGYTAAKTPDSKLRFDTDSYLIAIDSCASYCMTSHESDFVPGSLTKVNVKVKGLGNTVAKYKGTVRWKIQDDRGTTFTFDIGGALLLPTLPFRLLSPQHWAQHAGSQHGECTATIDKSTATLHWNGGSNVRTVELTNSNIALLRSAPSHHGYQAFLAELDHDLTKEFGENQCFPAYCLPISTGHQDEGPQYVTDDEDEEDSESGEEEQEEERDADTVAASNVSPQGSNRAQATGFEGAESERNRSGPDWSNTSRLEGATDARPGGEETANRNNEPVRVDFQDDLGPRREATTYPERPLEDKQAELLR
eukprot:scaffold6521_cov93-Cylindrotheca_fusiformis.AAC.2